MHLIVLQIQTLETLRIDTKKYTAKQYSFVVIDATLASDNPLYFRKNLLKIIEILLMTINNEIRNKKLQYNINIEAAKLLA